MNAEFLINKHSDYIYSFLWKSYPTYMKIHKEDMYNTCIVGVMKAIPNYDESKGAFTTFITPYMRHEITAYLCYINNDHSTYYTNLHNKILKAKSYIEAHGGKASPKAISEKTGISENVVETELKMLSVKITSLDSRNEPVREVDARRRHVCVGECSSSVSEAFAVDDILSCLTAEQKDIVVKHVLNEISFNRIARDRNTTPYEIKKIYKECMEKLKEANAA